jgi:ubiquinol-cytochrome c reductase cytochrome b subunit
VGILKLPWRWYQLIRRSFRAGWRLLVRIWEWFDDRTGTGKLLKPLLRHPVPPGADSPTKGWFYIFGILTLTAFILQVVTGIALALAYVPSTADAYNTLQFISHDNFGRVLRGMHYFGASAMIIFITFHMARVFLTGSFKFPREMNWVSGVILLLLTIIMAFTGQLLRWDADGVWTVVVAAEQAGRTPWIGGPIAHFVLAGRNVGAATLSRFFAYHVFFIPAAIFAVVGLHLYLILHNGISEPPEAGRPVDPHSYRAWYKDLVEKYGRPYFPDAAWREMVAAFLLIGTIGLLALIVGPKALGKPPNPVDVNVVPRPDWFLIPYYALLATINPALEAWVIILFPFVFFMVLFLVPFLFNRGERSPWRRPWAVGVVIAGALSVGAFFVIGNQAPWSPRFNTQPLSAQAVGATTPAAARGAQLFYSKGCQYCHAVEGHGGIRGPDLTHAASRLTTTDITERIMVGPGNMPSFRNLLTPDELNDIIAFLQAVDKSSSAKP